jgi:hypothetical protein
MPAALPGSTLAQNLANPSAGLNINLDLLSGPKGSPFDRDVQVPYNASPGGSGFPASGNCSTGQLSTGIGFGSPPIFGLTAPASIQAAGFSDDYIPGITLPSGVAATTSILMYIGGGKSDATGAPVPYTSGFGIGDGGQGGARDAGAGPAFQGFTTKTVTATASVANGAAVEAGWQNRSGVTITTGQSVFGSSTVASGVVA